MVVEKIVKLEWRVGYSSFDEATSPCRGSRSGNHGGANRRPFRQCRVPVDLLDIVLPNQPKRNAAALAGIEKRRAKQKPGGFFTDAAAGT